ncbi:hypothetical protein [Massilia endophytica]|uniref:hypothetical protein n=1 Tax=Massilia endophytica TaxID=2899220 RepID=UPI001E3D904C|nr:hypothetical protein [Massilia endophytica]UGQ44977.1 hypothetical protein LSQ66_14340 [Massilia endophytica]
MKTLLVFLCVVLSGCVSVKPTYLADGSMGHSITCNGGYQTMGACVEKAGEICGAAGFSIVDQYGSAVPFSVASGGIEADRNKSKGSFNAVSGVSTKRNMFVKCKG